VSTNVQGARRLEFVDAQRGLAVVLMLWMHTADGWLRPELKQGAAWDVVRAIGGLAAPTFLMLAGVSVALGWAFAASRSHAPTLVERRLELARGLQLIVLGYALRLQMWMVDAAGFELPEAWAAAVPLAVAYGAAYFGLEAWAREARNARRLGLVAASGAAIGFALVAELVPARLGPLLRVDVLQAIGASLAVLSLLREPLQRWPQLGLLLGVVVALLTPSLRVAMPGLLPPPLAGYLAHWEAPRGQPLATLFPLFPWMSYALIGATLGLWLGRAEQRAGGGAGRRALVLAAGGLAISVLTCEPLPSGHFLVSSWPSMTAAVRVAYRVGISLLLGGLAVGVCRFRGPARWGLLTLGRASLVVYWVHLEFAFGAAAKPIARTLDLQQWAQGLCVLVVAMTALAAGWVRFRTRLRPRQAAETLREISDPAALTGT